MIIDLLQFCKKKLHRKNNLDVLTTAAWDIKGWLSVSPLGDALRRSP